MSALYKKGEIVWAKIQGYSWWPGRITKIKLKLCIRKNKLGKYILKYEKEPYFYITFFPNDSISKVKLKYMKKFIDGYKIRSKTNKRKKLERAIDIATKTFLEENPNLNIDIKRNIFNLKLYSKKKFPLLRQFRALEEEEEEQNGENDIQSFIDSEINECEKYKNELKDKKNNKNKYIGNKRRKSNEEKEDTKSFNSESDKSNDILDIEEDINKKCNKELKKYSNELFKTSVEIKRRNTFNNIINVFNNIENIINKYNIDYNFNIIKDLIFILNNYNNHNNEEIMNKSISLHKDLICKYLNNIFKYDNDFLEKETLYGESLLKAKGSKGNNNSSKIILDMEELGNKIIIEIDNLKNKVFGNYSTLNEEENRNQNGKDINNSNTQLENKTINIINNDNNNSMINTNKKLKTINNYNFELNQELNDEKTVNNNIDYEFSKKGKYNNKYENFEEEIGNNDSFNHNEPFLKEIINNPNYFNKKPEGQLYPDNFFDEIYLKEEIKKENNFLRKKMCLQLYGVLQLALPCCQKRVIKNNVIYLEYLARNKDPLFGNKYKIIINMIYNRIKSEAVKIKNKNKK